jgi:hypothetical protein
MAEIVLAADHPRLVEEVGLLRWREWGYGDPSPREWIETTRREAGRDDLPVTLVAIDDDGYALGAVALGDADDALTWVVTGDPAVGFYRACSWTVVGELVTAKEQLPGTVLHRPLRPDGG